MYFRFRNGKLFQYFLEFIRVSEFFLVVNFKRLFQKLKPNLKATTQRSQKLPEDVSKSARDVVKTDQLLSNLRPKSRILKTYPFFIVKPRTRPQTQNLMRAFSSLAQIQKSRKRARISSNLKAQSQFPQYLET